MESLTRRSFIKTSTLALAGGVLPETAAVSETPVEHQHLTVLGAPSNLGLKPWPCLAATRQGLRNSYTVEV